MTRATLVAVLAGLTCLPGCGQPPTEVFLTVTSKLAVPAQLDHLMIRAEGADADGGFEHTYDLTRAPYQLPLSLGLVSATGGRPLKIVVEGLEGGAPISSTAVDTAFVSGETRVVSVEISAACGATPCTTAPDDAGADGGADTGDLTGPSRGDARGEACPDAMPAPNDATPPSTDAAPPSNDATPPLTHATLSTNDMAAGPLRGYTGPDETTFEDLCPAGSVVVGFNVATDHHVTPDVVDELQTICGVPSASSADGTTLVVSPGSTLSLRGSVGGTTVAPSVCPRDQVVVGFDGRSYALLDQLSIRCAPLTVAGASVSTGTPTNLAAVGGSGGDPFPRSDCGVGRVAVGANIGVRTPVSALGLVCASVALH